MVVNCRPPRGTKWTKNVKNPIENVKSKFVVDVYVKKIKLRYMKTKDSKETRHNVHSHLYVKLYFIVQ